MKKAKQKHFDHRILKANIQLSTRWLMTIKILMEKVSKNIEILVVLKNFAANPICDFVSYIYIVTNIFIQKFMYIAYINLKPNTKNYVCCTK